ncbi:MAG: GNAT family N-acetyltransferase [Candidatus Hermodarchaeota archaeon]
MVNIELIEAKKADLNELTHFYISCNYPEINHESYNAAFKRVKEQFQFIIDLYITDILIARSEEQIVGVQCLSTVMPSMVFIDEWDPTIRQLQSMNEIAYALIEKSKEFTRKQKRRNLRLFLGGITEERNARYLQYKSWYESKDFQHTHINLCLVIDLSKIKTRELEIIENYRTVPLKAVDNDIIKDSYNTVFKDTADRFIASLYSQEKEDFFNLNFDKNKLHDTSVALFNRNELIGFLGAQGRSEETIEIVGLGILPNYRGQGLGTKILLMQLKKFADSGFMNCYTEVDPENKAPYHLYKKYGFELGTKKSGFLWRAD